MAARLLGDRKSRKIARPPASDLRRKEIDGFGRRDGLDIFFGKPEQLDTLNQFTLQGLIFDLTRNNLTERHRARWLDREPKYQLPLERRIAAQRTIIQRVDRALVLVEYHFDFFAATSRSVTGAWPPNSRTIAQPRDTARNSCRIVIAES